jgi:hypothetical protein
MTGLAGLETVRLVWPYPAFYTSDTAVTDLMALHFARGEWSFYYWGERYYGVLDQVLLAPIFHFFGQTPIVSQSFGLAILSLSLFVFFAYSLKTFGRWQALLLLALVAVPPLCFLQFSLGTYNYALGPLLGFCQLYWWASRPRDGRFSWHPFIGGLIAGFGWYYFRVILVFWIGIALEWFATRYDLRSLMERHGRAFEAVQLRAWLNLQSASVPVRVRRVLVGLNWLNVAAFAFAAGLWVCGDINTRVGGTKMRVAFSDTAALTVKIWIAIAAIAYWQVLWRWAKRAWIVPAFRLFTIGFLIGYAPALLGTLFGKPPGSPGRLSTLPEFYGNLRIVFGEILPLYLGGHGRTTVSYIAGTLLVIGWGATLAQLWRWFMGKEKVAPSALTFAAIANLFLVIAAVPLVDVWQGRYFLPFFFAAPLGAVWILSRLPPLPRAIMGAVLVVPYLGINAWTIRNWPLPIERQQTDQAIIRFLVDSGLKAGFADYWIAYRLTAISQEKVVIAPTGEKDRYAPYSTIALSQSRTFIVQQSSLSKGAHVDVRGQSYRVVSSHPVRSMSVIELERI